MIKFVLSYVVTIYSFYLLASASYAKTTTTLSIAEMRQLGTLNSTKLGVAEERGEISALSAKVYSDTGVISPIDKLRELGSLNSTKVGVFAEEKQMVALGLIDNYMADWLERSIKAYPKIKTLYIDSPGGEGFYAARMAELIHKNDLKVIVNGRCFSACAQLIFIAAKTKEIMPGSMVGVHDAVINLNGELVYANTVLLSHRNQLTEERATKIRAELNAIEQFNKQYGFKTEITFQLRELQSKRRDYLTHHYQQSWQTKLQQTWAALTQQAPPALPDFNKDACLKIKLWLVNTTQLHEMGVRNIQRAWFPSNETELQKFLSRYELKREEFFVGNSTQLQALCRNTIH